MSIPLNTKQFAEKANRYMPVRTVSIDKLRPTQSTYVADKVEDIAAKPAGGPPVLVGRHNGKYHVLDGHHRVAGAILRGDSYQTVRIIPK